MVDQYKYGRDKEQKVAQSLRNRGAKVDVSKGSKGAADLEAKFSTGTKWKVQVKSTRGNKVTQPTPKDVGRLKSGATKSRATPVIAEVTPKGIKYESARTGKVLRPPKKK